MRGSQETHGHDSMPAYSMSIGVTVICSGLFSYLLARSGDELPIGLSFLLKKNKLSINKKVLSSVWLMLTCLDPNLLLVLSHLRGESQWVSLLHTCT